MLLTAPLCKFGWKAPDFILKDPDGISFQMSDHLGEKGLLIAFICNHCPHVQSIANSLVADIQILSHLGIKAQAVMPNDYHTISEDSPFNMKNFATKYGFNFPYLIDETQEVARTYSAVCTPDFFGLNASGKLQYRGRLDNTVMNNRIEHRIPELVNAMRIVSATGCGPRDQIPSMGCSIKWR